MGGERADSIDQMDLFGEAVVGEPEPSASSWPASREVKAPCPWCIRLADLASLQYQADPLASSGEPECGQCGGTGSVLVIARQAQGFWWDCQRSCVVEAVDATKAARKMGEGVQPLPLYVDCGGYAEMAGGDR